MCSGGGGGYGGDCGGGGSDVDGGGSRCGCEGDSGSSGGCGRDKKVRSW